MLLYEKLKKRTVVATLGAAQVAMVVGGYFLGKSSVHSIWIGGFVLGVVAADFGIIAVWTVVGRDMPWRWRVVVAAVASMLISVFYMLLVIPNPTREIQLTAEFITAGLWTWGLLAAVTYPVANLRGVLKPRGRTLRFQVRDLVALSTIVALLVAWHVNLVSLDILRGETITMAFLLAIHSLALRFAWTDMSGPRRFATLLGSISFLYVVIDIGSFSWEAKEICYFAVIHSSLLLLWVATFFPRRNYVPVETDVTLEELLT